MDHPGNTPLAAEARTTLRPVIAERNRRWFLTIEGPEGAGKTTQAARLAASIRALGHETVLTREPGGTALGEQVRAIVLDAAARHEPRTDALLFNAARAQLVAEVIGPALARGAIVLATRFADSTLAYQGHGAGLPIEELRALERVATGGLRPDLTLLLDLPVEEGLERKGTERTRFETAFDVAFHRRVRTGFLELAAAEPERFRVIDAGAEEGVVAGAIVDAVASLPGLEGLRGLGTARSEPSGRLVRSST